MPVGCCCVQMLCDSLVLRPLGGGKGSKQVLGSRLESGESMVSEETTLVMESVGEVSPPVWDMPPGESAPDVDTTEGLLHQLGPHTEEEGSGATGATGTGGAGSQKGFAMSPGPIGR